MIVKDLLKLYESKKEEVVSRLISLYSINKDLFDNYIGVYNKLLEKQVKNVDTIIVVWSVNIHSQNYDIEVYSINSNSIYFDNIDFMDWEDFISSRFVTSASLVDTVAAMLYYISSVSFCEEDIKSLKQKIERSF